jgi:hypothetical protein
MANGFAVLTRGILDELHGDSNGEIGSRVSGVLYFSQTQSDP